MNDLPIIRLFYSRSGDLWDEQKLQLMARSLPLSLQQKILLYHEPAGRQLRIMGKLLLTRMIHEFGLQDNYSLIDIQYNIFNRPYFHGDFDFNISHSGEVVVCAAITKGKVGTDIEKIVPGIAPYQLMELAVEQRTQLRAEPDPGDAFYRLWTRKEALLKASGKGVFGNAEGINMNQSRIEFDDDTFFMQDVTSVPGYRIALACNVEESMHRPMEPVLISF